MSRKHAIQQVTSAVGRFVFLSLLFGIAYTQAPIYRSAGNQNTKFLHGLAQAGHGFLHEDWLANTLNPLPVFSALVQWTYQSLHPEYLFYVYHWLIFGLYLYSAFGITNYFYFIRQSRLKYWVYLAAFVFVHTVHIELFEFDTAWHLHAGTAGQYILDMEFQPASFGVFILLSIWLFLYRRSLWAVGCLAVAVTVHPTYLLSAAVLTMGYAIATLIEPQHLSAAESKKLKVRSKKSETQNSKLKISPAETLREQNSKLSWLLSSRNVQFSRQASIRQKLKQAIAICLLAFVLILPVFSYMYTTFDATSPEVWSRAKYIIAHLRIPHHSIPKVWLADGTAYVQALVVAVAVYLVRGTRLFGVMLIAFAIALTLTTAQILLDSNTLAFIAPWRLSVFLVPISTYLILGAILDWGFQQVRRFPTAKLSQCLRQHRSWIKALSFATLTALFVVGLWNQIGLWRAQDDTIPMMNFVRQTKQSGQVYLVPPDPRNLRKFRLYTGAPIFINHKSHPYKDSEVLEWYQRLERARAFYQADKNEAGATGESSCQQLQELVSQYRITHVVLESKPSNPFCTGLDERYQDDRYQVYRIDNQN